MKKHSMKYATQSCPELTQVAKLFKDAPIAMMTTMQNDEALASRPMAAMESDAQGALWFLTDLRSSKAEHLRVVNLCLLRAFGAIASVIAGRPVALGEHRSLAGLSDPVTAAAAYMELN